MWLEALFTQPIYHVKSTHDMRSTCTYGIQVVLNSSELASYSFSLFFYELSICGQHLRAIMSMRRISTTDSTGYQETAALLSRVISLRECLQGAGRLGSDDVFRSICSVTMRLICRYFSHTQSNLQLNNTILSQQARQQTIFGCEWTIFFVLSKNQNGTDKHVCRRLCWRTSCCQVRRICLATLQIEQFMI